ncbi:glycosyltransferase [Flavobacteriaceae bacterium AU392]|nr:glycosyltransferase [Flavobacteriaceae bacterium]RKM82951.1 glycosyltransferase [Flavobacteriaceae bacterium AU392]
MKILMVAIPNHHFFQWVDQLKNSGHEVFWFDITDGGPESKRIDWVKQIKGWKLKKDYPFRFRIKKRLPKLYTFIQKRNEYKVSEVFEELINEIQPDIVHCFEMQLSGLPILDIMKQNAIPFIYSSWGSDVFYFEKMGVTKQQAQDFYDRTDYLITDCKRDYNIILNNGYESKFLGVFPGNGGLTVDINKIQPMVDRNTILIKGYDDGIGKASIVLKALELVSEDLINDKKIIIYSADHSLKNIIKNSKLLSTLKITIYSRYSFIQNTDLLELMGKSCLHIANSISDGMPNALLEAMSMGAFPIQSNPGGVTEEVIINKKNGFLIENALDVNHIKELIEQAILNDDLRKKAKDYNVKFIQKNYNRTILQSKILKLYETVNTID